MRHWTLMRLRRLAMRGMMMCRLFLGHSARRRSRRIGRRNERRRGECESGNQSESRDQQSIHCRHPSG